MIPFMLCEFPINLFAGHSDPSGGAWGGLESGEPRLGFLGDAGSYCLPLTPQTGDRSVGLRQKRVREAVFRPGGERS